MNTTKEQMLEWLDQFNAPSSYAYDWLCVKDAIRALIESGAPAESDKTLMRLAADLGVPFSAAKIIHDHGGRTVAEYLAEIDDHLAPAPLPKEVEEAMGKIENLLGGFGPNVFRDEFGRRIHYPRDTMAALAVIKAALQPKVVSREHVDKLLSVVVDQPFVYEVYGSHRSECIDAMIYKLRELGIEVEEKP